MFSSEQIYAFIWGASLIGLFFTICIAIRTIIVTKKARICEDRKIKNIISIFSDMREHIASIDSDIKIEGKLIYLTVLYQELGEVREMIYNLSADIFIDMNTKFKSFIDNEIQNCAEKVFNIVKLNARLSNESESKSVDTIVEKPNLKSKNHTIVHLNISIEAKTEADLKRYINAAQNSVI